MDQCVENGALVEYEQMKKSQDYIDGWTETKRLILEIKALANKNNAGFMLLLIPSRIQVNEPEWGSVLNLYLWNKEDFDLSKPNSILSRFAETEKIGYLDLLPYFKEATTSRRLYYSYDGHWTCQGHELASYYLMDKILGLADI